jgi:peptidylprolyl isomerase
VTTRGVARPGCRFRTVSLVALATLALAVGSCSADDAPEGSAEESAEDALDLGAAPAPSAILPEDRGDPPAALQIEDLVEGSGDVVNRGDVLTVEYLGWRWSDGGEFASSWGPGEPLRFELGSQDVIPGWERGVLGLEQEEGPLREGGRRVLVIPPELAYGDRGAGAAIGPEETLVFVIDLVAVDTGPDPDDPIESERPDA